MCIRKWPLRADGVWAAHKKILQTLPAVWFYYSKYRHIQFLNFSSDFETFSMQIDVCSFKALSHRLNVVSTSSLWSHSTRRSAAVFYVTESHRPHNGHRVKPLTAVHIPSRASAGSESVQTIPQRRHNTAVVQITCRQAKEWGPIFILFFSPVGLTASIRWCHVCKASQSAQGSRD